MITTEFEELINECIEDFRKELEDRSNNLKDLRCILMEMLYQCHSGSEQKILEDVLFEEFQEYKKTQVKGN